MTNAVARKLESLREKGAMRHIDVANILGTRPETVSRWNQGRVNREDVGSVYVRFITAHCLNQM